MYFFVVGFVTGIYTLMTLLLGRYFQDILNVNVILITLAVSTIIVFTLDPLKHAMSYITDNIFYKARIDYQVVLRRAVNTLNTELELQPLVKKLTDTVQKELKLKNVRLLLPDKKGNTFSSDGFDSINPIKLTLRSSLGNYIKREQEILVLEEFQRKVADILDEDVRTSYQKIEQQMERLDFSIVVPIIVKKNLLALLMAGSKLSGDPFSNDDINFFEVLAPQIGTSITKAQLYLQVKEFNIDLTKPENQLLKEMHHKTRYNIKVAQRNGINVKPSENI